MEVVEKRIEQVESVILCYNTYDYKSDLKINDLVCIEDEYYNILKINPRYGKKDNESDNEYKYFVESKINGELMNFKRSEISKANLGYFYADAYFNNNIKKIICTVPINNPEYKKDINYIKAKFACDWDMGKSEFESIQTCHLNELTINGTVTYHERDIMYHSELQPNFKTFKVNIK